MNTSTPQHNLGLARSLVADLLEFQPDIEPSVWDLLDGSDESESLLVTGETTEEITEWLKTVLSLASKPVPLPTAGRNKQVSKYRQECARERIRLIASARIALLESDNSGVQETGSTVCSGKRTGKVYP